MEAWVNSEEGSLGGGGGHKVEKRGGAFNDERSSAIISHICTRTVDRGRDICIYLQLEFTRARSAPPANEY